VIGALPFSRARRPRLSRCSAYEWKGTQWRMLYIDLPAGSSGSVDGITLRNISADRASLPAGMPSNLLAALSSGSSLSGVVFDSVAVGGVCWTARPRPTCPC